jgi:2-C-methyl-D-erythritol 4-phosphate cytidylyltransferase
MALPRRRFAGVVSEEVVLKCAMSNFHVLIPAAGSGSRMGAETPKQYLPLLGQPLILHTLAVFTACPRIESITLVLNPQDAHWSEVGGKQQEPKLHVERCGGNTRAASVLNGLQVMQERVRVDDWILVHDAARPCLSAELLQHLLDAVQHDPVGGLLAIPLADTLKRADHEQRVSCTEQRDGLWLAQTPQMFRYELLTRALTATGGKPTDEAQAVEALGLKPKLVHGELRNLKITYTHDLALAEAILGAGNGILKAKDQ